MDDTPDRQVAELFEGIDCASDPTKLPPGVLQDGTNVWCKGDGYVETRPGLKHNCDIAQHQLLAEYGGQPAIRGLGFYDVPAAEFVFAMRNQGSGGGVGGSVWSIPSAGNAVTPTKQAFYGGAGTEYVTFVQLVDRVFFIHAGVLNWLMYSGGVWSGAPVTQFSDATPMPAWSRLAVQNFRLLAWEADGYKMYASAIGQAHNAADWVKTENFRVGNGSGDPTKAAIPGQAGFITQLNAQSVWQIDVSAASVANWSSLRVTGLTGCVEGRTAVAMGQDVYFLSQVGVVNLGALAATDSLSPSTTLSAPIQPYIDRINWSAIGNAFATSWKDLYLLALPLDAYTYPRHIFAFNVRTKRWMAPWLYALTQNVQPDSSNTAFDGFTAACVTNFGDKSETLLGDNTGRVMRIDESVATDEAEVGAAGAIYSVLATRAFTHGDSQAIKQPLMAELELQNAAAANMQLALNRDGAAMTTDSFTMGQRQIGTTVTSNSGGLEKYRWLARGQSTAGPYREGALQLYAQSGKLRVRKLALASFADPPFFT